jgi:hypothetical protein
MCDLSPSDNDQVDRGPANQPSIMSAIDRTFDRTICYYPNPIVAGMDE